MEPAPIRAALKDYVKMTQGNKRFEDHVQNNLRISLRAYRRVAKGEHLASDQVLSNLDRLARERGECVLLTLPRLNYCAGLGFPSLDQN